MRSSHSWLLNVQIIRSHSLALVARRIYMADSAASLNNLIIGEGVTFHGSIAAPGKASINGTVTGELTADDLQIGRSGKVTGKVKAREIDVHGQLNQDIESQSHILIHSTGKVSGALQYSELEIQRGGQFEGTMTQKG